MEWFTMMTSSNGNIFRVTSHLCGEFTGSRWIPHKKPVTRSFNVFFDLRLNKRLSKQWWGWWFDMPWGPLWRHCNKSFVCRVISFVQATIILTLQVEKKNSSNTSWKSIKPSACSIFHRKYKNISTIYIIPPHWHDTGSWNLSSCKKITYLFFMVNIIIAGVLATQGARASATMILICWTEIIRPRTLRV